MLLLSFIPLYFIHLGVFLGFLRFDEFDRITIFSRSAVEYIVSSIKYGPVHGCFRLIPLVIVPSLMRLGMTPKNRNLTIDCFFSKSCGVGMQFVVDSDDSIRIRFIVTNAENIIDIV